MTSDDPFCLWNVSGRFNWRGCVLSFFLSYLPVVLHFIRVPIGQTHNQWCIGDDRDGGSPGFVSSLGTSLGGPVGEEYAMWYLHGFSQLLLQMEMEDLSV